MISVMELDRDFGKKDNVEHHKKKKKISIFF